MSEPARNRFALDLEDLERQLRGAGQAQRPTQSPDPLAELTRIVTQDDPLRDIFAERRPQAVPPMARHEPSLAVVPPGPTPLSPPVGEPPAEMRGALDEFEALLRRAEPERRPVPTPQPQYQPREEPPMEGFDRAEPAAYAHPAQPLGGVPARDLDDDQGFYQPAPAYGQAQGYEPGAYEAEPVAHGYENMQPAYQPEYAEDDMPDLEPRRSRKGLWAAAAVIAVGVIGVGGTMMLRGGSSATDGPPPVITAESGPVKVEPANPGGTVIPNQNKQIYERSAEDPEGKSKLVDNREEPVDVEQAARSMPTRVILPGPGTDANEAGTGSAPANSERSIATPEPAFVPMPPVPGLGEPRKVRTVSIRPDGTPTQAAAVRADSDQPLATGSAPSRAPAANAGSMSLPAVATPSAAAIPPPAPKAQERATTPSAATTPAAPMRLASAPAEAAPQEDAAPAIRPGSGDYLVQLGAPGSEREARATFAALQRKYGQMLGGLSPIIRKTELAGGKVVYRLRVGPYSRDDARSMCSQLQAAGGQCFIAKS